MPSVSASASRREPFYEDGRRWTWLAPVVLAAAGWCILGLVVFAFLIVPGAAAEGRESVLALLAVLGVSGLVLAAAGTVIGPHRARPATPVFLRSVTVVLAVLAGSLGMAVASYVFVLSRGVAAGSEHVFRYMIALCGLLAVALVALCALRAFRVRVAAVLTPAFALIALPIVPFGTVVAVAWLVWARKRETSAL